MVRNSEWGREDPTATAAERFGDIIESTTPADAGEYDVVLLGEPSDTGTTGRTGARAAPAAIRDALDGVQTHHLDAGPVDSVADLGTVAIPASASVSTARERIRETVDALHDADTIPVILGGSGSLTYANVAGLLEATAVTDGGEQIEDLRSSSELRSDGGFGEDEDSVGDVEHFDPTRDEETSEDSADSEAGDGEETDEIEETDDSEEDDTEGDSDEAESAADEEKEAEPESGTDDEETVEDETAEDADEPADDEQTDEEETAEDEDDEPGETDDDEQKADETAGEADETTETPEDQEKTETSEDDETAESSDEAVDDDSEAESAVDDTAFAMPDSETETEVIEESAASPDTGADTATSEAGSVGVVSLDARLDCRPVDDRPTNRTGYRELFEAGLDALAVLGARHFESSTTEAEYLRDGDGMVVTAEEVGDDPVEAADRALGAMEDVEQIYVSIDLSVLDSAAAPAVSDPAPGGLSTRELFRVVRLLASDDRIAGFELVEAVPALDRDGRTVDAAARTVAHAVATVGE